MIYAKSNPAESLKEHTENLLERYDILRKKYENEINNILPFENKEIFWQMLYDACFYHDFGKVFTPFQNEIKKRLKKDITNTKFKNNIPHGFLSPAFISHKIALEKYGKLYLLLIAAIANHHERDKNPTEKEIFNAIVEDLEINKDLVSNEFGMTFGILNKKYINYIHQSNYINYSKEEEILLTLLKGLLVRIDHSASAHLSIEDNFEDISKLTDIYIKTKFNNLREVQIICKNNKDKNMIVVASTGMGKTEAALLWAGENKCFYTLPLRAALNSMYLRIKKMGVSSLGLLHSSSLDFLENNSFEDAYEVYENSRLLSYRLSLSTIDQLFGFPFKYKGYEKVLATLAYSRIVLDEIQSYSPKITAVLLKGIEILHSFGSKFLIITATMPPIYQDFLNKRGIQFESSKHLLEINRHKIELKQKEIVDDIDLIVKYGKSSKVLVIANTISKAVEIYNRIKQNEDVKVNLLHSQFISKHRLIKEKLIVRYDVKNKPGIWIATQVVEASLDIDFDFLFTELSSLDSLFQRMGRCFRKRELNSSLPNVFIYTENSSGIGYIYDKDIFELSKNALQEYNGKLIDEKAKMKLIEEVFSYNTLKGTGYYKEFENALNILDNFVADDLKKDDVQKILRPINNIRAVPSYYHDKNIELFRNYKKVKDFKQKSDILRQINQLCVDIPYYKVKNKITSIEGLKGIYRAEIEYNSQIGVIHDKEVSGIIG